VSFLNKHWAVLPPGKLKSVIGTGKHSNLIMALGVDLADEEIYFITTSGKVYAAGFTLFKPNAKYKPDFSRPSLTDYGQTVRFGGYEVSSVSILKEAYPC
jgi:hypothetical protein